MGACVTSYLSQLKPARQVADVSLYAGCVNMGDVAGLEVQMTSSNPLSLLYSTDRSGSPYWKGVSVLYNPQTGSQQDFYFKMS